MCEDFLDEDEQVGEHDRREGRQQRHLGDRLCLFAMHGQGIATFVEAADEIEAMTMEAPPHTHLIMA